MSLLKDLLSFDRKMLSGKTAEARQLLLFDKPRAKYIIGVDEVGRGCLAGPVVAAAAMFDNLSGRGKEGLDRLNDSKTLSEATRIELASALKSHCRFFIAEASVQEIDSINILQASLLAMKRAITGLLDDPTLASAEYGGADFLVLVDGNKKIKNLGLEQVTVIKGDGRSASIAAASVLAKVYRDQLMDKLAEQYPDYGWQSNKGYPSALHREGIKHGGISPWHRLSFRLLKDESED